MQDNYSSNENSHWTKLLVFGQQDHLFLPVSLITSTRDFAKGSEESRIKFSVTLTDMNWLEPSAD